MNKVIGWACWIFLVLGAAIEYHTDAPAPTAVLILLAVNAIILTRD